MPWQINIKIDWLILSVFLKNNIQWIPASFWILRKQICHNRCHVSAAKSPHKYLKIVYSVLKQKYYRAEFPNLSGFAEVGRVWFHANDWQACTCTHIFICASGRMRACLSHKWSMRAHARPLLMQVGDAHSRFRGPVLNGSWPISGPRPKGWGPLL